jgi:RNA polymerase sigma factor (sigma-70 family)
MDKQEERRLRTELLVLQVKQGRGQAFEELVDLWQRPLWSHACRLTRDEQASWDVTQEAWITIARKIITLEDESQFPGWSFRIVTNKALDWLRRRKRQRAGVEHAAKIHQESEVEQPAQMEVAEPTFQELISRLSTEEQVLLSLRYEQDFSTVQIGRILSIKEGTVKSRLYHARMKIKHLLEDRTHDRQQ